MKHLRRSTLNSAFVIITLMLTGTETFAMARPLPSEESPAPEPTPKKDESLPSSPPPQTSAVVAPLWEAKRSDGKEWTSHVINKLDTLGKHMLEKLPSDFATFCPRYDRLSYSEKKAYWAYLMSAMVKHESGFNPASTYKESFKDANGNYVISRGLLQISIESSRGYDCGVHAAKELHDPYVNLSCGIRILDRWVSRDGRIAGKVDKKWRGGARYWSVLRTTSGSYSSIISASKAWPLCK